MPMIRHDIARLPAFRGESWPWIGGDLQTIRSVLMNDAPSLAQGDMLTIPLDDGDALTAMLHQTHEDPKGVIIIVHGLTGCMDSHHVLQLAKPVLDQGYHVLRVNMRGAGLSAPLSKKRYSAKSGADLCPFIHAMKTRFPALPLFMVAHSIGGAAALNMAVDCDRAEISALDGLITVAAPLDLHEASRRLHTLKNRPYLNYLLKGLKKMAHAMPDLDMEKKTALQSVKTIRHFDAIMTAPMMGFQTVDDYYDAASTMHKLDNPDLPILLLHADNDPWVGMDAYVNLQQNDRLDVLIARGGGHVGFYDDKGLWLPRVILAWIKQINT